MFGFHATRVREKHRAPERQQITVFGIRGEFNVLLQGIHAGAEMAQEDMGVLPPDNLCQCSPEQKRRKRPVFRAEPGLVVAKAGWQIQRVILFQLPGILDPVPLRFVANLEGERRERNRRSDQCQNGQYEAMHSLLP